MVFPEWLQVSFSTTSIFLIYDQFIFDGLMSQHNRYIHLDVSSNSTVFEFTSTGPKGDILKIIQFSQTEINNVYNLGFGNIRNDGSIDDTTTNDNKDRDKILATVASAVNEFTDRFPHRQVFFTGSTKERTRLYRMAITINYEVLSTDYEIWGLKDEGLFEPFVKRRQYAGFLIKRKKS